MKTVTGNELGAQPALRDDLTAPTPGANEVLVRGHASSVNPVDDGIAAGMAKDMVPHEFPVLTSTLGAPAVLLAVSDAGDDTKRTPRLPARWRRPTLPPSD